jgi:hypothetical protein
MDTTPPGEFRDDDRYFDLVGLAAYSGLSTKTLRRYMDDPKRPLPTHHIRSSTSERGRILVSKREFDAWVASFPPGRATKVAPSSTRLNAKVAAAVKSIRGQ